MSRAIVLAGALVAIAGASQAADFNDHITPPSQNDLAVLRGLLALQHPALRQAGGSIPAAPAAVAPAVTTEPGQQQGANPAPATEGEASGAPQLTGDATCGLAVEAPGMLSGAFRISLARAVTAAGFESQKL